MKPDLPAKKTSGYLDKIRYLTGRKIVLSNRKRREDMSDADAGANSPRLRWRELCRNQTPREILYYVAGSPDGVRETKIKSFMHEGFRISIQGSIDQHLKTLEAEGLLTRESTRSGAVIWHADEQRVLELVQKELEKLEIRVRELRDLQEYLVGMYAD